MKLTLTAKRLLNNRKYLVLGITALAITGGTIVAVNAFASGSFSQKVVDLTLRSKSCRFFMHGARYVNEGGTIVPAGQTGTKLVQCNGKKDRFGTYTINTRFKMKHNGRESSYGIYVDTVQGDHFLRKLVSPHTRYTKLHVSR